MWKRLQSHVRDRDRQIGSPVLVETTYDENRLRQIPHVAQAQNAYHQPEAIYASQVHTASTNHDEPGSRASEVPTVSSMYSQPSPRMQHNPNHPATEHSFDISPPSSPETDRQPESHPGQPRRFRSMRDVSPVDENRGRSLPVSRAPSSIPILRKVAPSLRNQDPSATQKFWGGKVPPNSKVRWDEYSGEPTSSNAGKAPQVTPGSYQVGTTSPPHSQRNSEKSALKEARPQEPWSRATGRAEIAKPFKDQPSDKPLSSRKTDTAHARDLEKPPLTSPNLEAARVPARRDTNPVTEHDAYGIPTKSLVPLKVSRTSVPGESTSPTSLRSVVEANPYTYSPTTSTRGAFSTIPPEQNSESVNNTAASRTPTTPTPGKESEGHTVLGITRDNGGASRFSWTTYNSGTTTQHSPPPSPPTPVPNSKISAAPILATSAVISRKRQVAAVDRVPVRKPISTTSTTPTARNMGSDPPSPRPDSTFSTSTHKALPRPPTELAAADHLEILESQMEDLKVRRSNVYRLLSDLNNMAPPNPMVTDFKRMRLVEQRKKEFADELAEIKREEHDVGLKLHRAWRKREMADPGSESALWIRRVTQ